MANCVTFPPRNSWPVGFRFHPTDEELINHYLKNKMLGLESLVEYIRELDICKHDPWELPSLSNDETGDHEWFFFCAQDFKYSKSRRSNRATASGYWKSTGKDRKITARGTNGLIGTKKTLVFYRGRVPNGVRTNWVIHEYHPFSDTNFSCLRSFVICRLKRKVDKNVDSTYDEHEPNGLPFENVPENEPSIVQPDILVSDYEMSEFLFTDPEPTSMEPTLMEVQATITNGLWTEVVIPQIASGPSEEDVDPEDFVNSILVDDEDCFLEETQNNSTYGFYVAEMLNLVNQNPGAGFQGTTGMDEYEYEDEDFNGQRLHSISWGQAQGPSFISSVLSCDDHHQINGMSSYGDNYNEDLRTFRSQRQPKSNKVVAHIDASERVQLKRETECLVKVEEDGKPVKDSVSIEDQISEVKNDGHVDTQGKDFSTVLATKCIHHNLSSFAYATNAFIGVILFVVIVQEAVLFGNW